MRLKIKLTYLLVFSSVEEYENECGKREANNKNER